jgi:cysteine desulfurase
MIYLDNAATTKTKDIVIDKLIDVEKNCYGNASAKYYEQSELAKTEIKNATDKIKNKINSKIGDELIFTSGATESNNLFIQGFTRNYQSGHVITSVTEHASVYEVMQYLETIGFEVTYLKPSELGQITAQQVVEAIKEDTILVSVMYVNGETGHINQIKELASKNEMKNITFHSDFTQSFGKIEVDISNFKYLNAISFSGHKIGCMKGIGGLLLIEDDNLLTPTLKPIYFGGEQQNGLRPGTLPTSLIAALGEAFNVIKLNNSLVCENKKMIINKLKKKYPDIFTVNFKNDITVPHVLSIRFKGILNQEILNSLAKENVISASSGSACSITKPSHVLKGLGFSPDEIKETIRISFSNETEIDEETIDKI